MSRAASFTTRSWQLSVNVYVTDHVGSRATGSALPWEGDDAHGFVLKLPAR